LPEYVPREKNVIQKIFKNHFSDFEQQYDDHYAQRYGKYRIIRIKEAVEKFLECGDYSGTALFWKEVSMKKALPITYP
jgi:hypothetical protein